MKTVILCLLTLFPLCTLSQTHFISDSNYRQKVEADLAQKKALNIFVSQNWESRKDLTSYEREALSFLYAYMPLSDICDQNVDFYINNIRTTRTALSEMPWGKDIDETLIRHFVLPLRVNNEPLDNSRKVLYEQLKPRIQHLTIKEAILEVNHWCHEHVTYTPSDGRTSSPLQTLRTAYGRCGEESTFCVAALRSVGIPSRQVYTPRWAHTDDNHAWVEVWADGEWHFIGACEPEATLNLAWFNGPASRAMLVHTKVFGRYEGPEEQIIRKPNYTEINVLNNYAKTSRLDIQVVDTSGRPVPEAKVEFKLYNYAEFFTLATKLTDINGTTFLTSGKGDLLIWASKEGRWGYCKASFGREKSKTIILSNTTPAPHSEDYDIVPPNEDFISPEVSEIMRTENNRRLEYEDSVRNIYVATMFTHESAVKWCFDNSIDTTIVPRFLVNSRGNHPVITQFLKTYGRNSLAISMLALLSEKDLRDVPLNILESHLNHSTKQVSTSSSDIDYLMYAVANPRIDLEPLTPYKEYFSKELTSEQKSLWADPQKFISWINQNITINDDLNVTSTSISPSGVWKTKIADSKSRDIFFVAVMRSIGVISRISSINGKPQYKSEGHWIDAVFGESIHEEPTGTLRATYKAIPENDNPKYYYHFTISRFNGNSYELQNYSATDTYRSLLAKGLKLPEGHYMMVTGNRQSDGSVLTHVEYFDIHAGQETIVPLIMRSHDTSEKQLGTINVPDHFTPQKRNSPTVPPANADGWYALGIIRSGQEPTNHALRDISAYHDYFQNQLPLTLLHSDRASSRSFHPEEFPLLPNNTTWGIDSDNSWAQSIIESAQLHSSVQYPLFIIANRNGQLLFISQGYTIGLGESMKKAMK